MIHSKQKKKQKNDLNHDLNHFYHFNYWSYYSNNYFILFCFWDACRVAKADGWLIKKTLASLDDFLSWQHDGFWQKTKLQEMQGDFIYLIWRDISWQSRLKYFHLNLFSVVLIFPLVSALSFLVKTMLKKVRTFSKLQKAN